MNGNGFSFAGKDRDDEVRGRDSEEDGRESSVVLVCERRSVEALALLDVSESVSESAEL